jgi:photosystem II stability/assembly factor-like uncharacterized protein
LAEEIGMSGKPAKLFVGAGTGLLDITRSNSHWDVQPSSLRGVGVVRGLVIDAKDPDRMYAATLRGGVQRSLDGGRSWHAANQGILYLEGYSICQQPDTGELYFGTEPASVFKSADGGDSWTDCSKLRDMEETLFWKFPQPPHIAHMKDIQVSALDPKLVYGAVEEGWVVHSKDGGQSWVTLKQGVDFDAHAVTLMPDDVQALLATTGRGTYRSENGGKTFERSDEGITGPMGGGYMSPAKVHPQRPGTLFAGAAELPPPWWRTRREGANSHFFRSDDRGRTWMQLTHGDDVITAGPRAVAIDPNDPDRVLFGLSNGDVWLTEDGGKMIDKAFAELGGPVWVIQFARG